MDEDVARFSSTRNTMEPKGKPFYLICFVPALNTQQIFGREAKEHAQTPPLRTSMQARSRAKKLQMSNSSRMALMVAAELIR